MSLSPQEELELLLIELRLLQLKILNICALLETIKEGKGHPPSLCRT